MTPLTSYRRAEPVYAIDNGAFSSFDEVAFFAMLTRYRTAKMSAKFIAVPDVVGDHRATLARWHHYAPRLQGWPLAFVAQDGYDCRPVSAKAVFIGGSNKFKDSAEALEVVRDCLNNGLHCHVGRVNTPGRWLRFTAAGAHTCDGSGVSRYDHMWLAIKECSNAERA